MATQEPGNQPDAGHTVRCAEKVRVGRRGLSLMLGRTQGKESIWQETHTESGAHRIERTHVEMETKRDVGSMIRISSRPKEPMTTGQVVEISATPILMGDFIS